MKRFSKYIRVYRHIPPFSATLFVLIAILYLTLVPHPLPEEDMPSFPGADKVVHAVMFGGLALVALFDLRLSMRRRLGLGVCIVVTVLSTVLGGCIELLQQAMSMGRGADWLDFLADAVGALAALILWRRWANRI